MPELNYVSVLWSGFSKHSHILLEHWTDKQPADKDLKLDIWIKVSMIALLKTSWSAFACTYNLYTNMQIHISRHTSLMWNSLAWFHLYFVLESSLYFHKNAEEHMLVVVGLGRIFSWYEYPGCFAYLNCLAVLKSRVLHINIFCLRLFSHICTCELILYYGCNINKQYRVCLGILLCNPYFSRDGPLTFSSYGWHNEVPKGFCCWRKI